MPLVVKVRRSSASRWARWFLLVIGAALLGYVAFSLVEAKVFQAYENWQLNKALDESRASFPMVAPAAAKYETESHVAPIAGSMLGRIDIGSVGIAVIIVEGSDGKALRRAVGHLAGTPLPGERGNVVLTGHRDTFFRPLRNISHDDEVTLTTLKGTYRYRVDSTRVVGTEDTEVLKDSDEAILTLVTCYPFYYVGPAPKRFIVRAHKI